MRCLRPVPGAAPAVVMRRHDGFGKAPRCPGMLHLWRFSTKTTGQRGEDKYLSGFFAVMFYAWPAEGLCCNITLTAHLALTNVKM